MARFVGIDISADVITLQFDYTADMEEEILKIVRKKLGDNVPLDEFAPFVKEIDGMELS